MRVRPRPSLAFAIGIGYIVLFLVLELIAGVDYDAIGDSTHNVLRAVVAPLAVASVLLVVLTTALGWWRPVLRELPSDPPRPPQWMLALPALVLATILVNIPYGDLGDLGASYLLWLLIGTLMVGFSEEIVYRGMAVVGLRAGYREVYVWLWSTLMFALLHSVNLILGQGAGATVQQFFFAFVLGGVLYAIRRTTGTIVAVMVLHGLWDFSTISRHTAVSGDASLAYSLASEALLIAMVVIFLVGAKKLFSQKVAKTAPAAEPEAAAS